MLPQVSHRQLCPHTHTHPHRVIKLQQHDPTPSSTWSWTHRWHLYLLSLSTRSPFLPSFLSLIQIWITRGASCPCCSAVAFAFLSCVSLDTLVLSRGKVKSHMKAARQQGEQPQLLVASWNGIFEKSFTSSLWVRVSVCVAYAMGHTLVYNVCVCVCMRVWSCCQHSLYHNGLWL